MCHVQANFMADPSRHDVVVPGQNLDLDAVVFQGRERFGDHLFGRIEKGEDPDPHQVTFIGDGIGPIRRGQSLGGDRDDP